MKAIILAAGRGKRLYPLTKNKPKCMVEVFGRPLISHTLMRLRDLRITDISIVTGYKDEVLRDFLDPFDVKFYHNDQYATSNMVKSLFCAKEEFNDDIVVSYSDIVYSKSMLSHVLSSRSNIAVAVDRDWRKLWKIRFGGRLVDYETMRIDSQGYITQLGRKPTRTSHVDGQYVGLFKIRKHVLPTILAFYDGLSRRRLYDSHSFNNMYMTTFLQLIIDRVMKVKAVSVRGGWVEIDSQEDLRNYNREKNLLTSRLFL